MTARIDFGKHFHTELRPVDCAGQKLCPLDLVIINDIPRELYSDEGLENLQGYIGKYGLISYFMNQPFYYGKKDHPGWVSGDGSMISVLTRKISKARTDGRNVVTTWDFWLAPKNLTKIPFNSLVMNIFADYPWQMPDDDGPSDHHFIVEGMEQYAHIERVLNSPYESLVKAHDAAISALNHGHLPSSS
jgi:hypothetical protein